MSDIPPLYSLTEAAEMLRMSSEYLRSKLRDHTYPGLKLAGKWAMTEDQIVEAIEIMSMPARVEVASPAGLARGSRFRRKLQEKAS